MSIKKKVYFFEKYPILGEEGVIVDPVLIFTDGSTGITKSGNKAGGFAMVIYDGNKGTCLNKSYSYSEETDSYHMELLAIDYALDEVTHNEDLSIKKVHIYCDNRSIVTNFNKIPKLIKNDYKNTIGGDIKRKDEWKSVATKYMHLKDLGFEINCYYVRGHNDNTFNSKADNLAVDARLDQ